MGDNPTGPEIDALLSQADWLHRLARCLVHNRPDADDLVQETWVAAMRSPPEAGRPARPWLNQVMRNLIRMDLRGAGRRRTREDQVGALDSQEAPSPEALLERLELQRMVGALIKELEEPFRSTLLLRFFEGRLPADIARAQGVPAGTVRWRIHQGLERLRQRLDESHGGQREKWRALFLPFTGSARPGGSAGDLPRAGLPVIKLAAAIVGVAGTLGVFVALNRGSARPPQRPAPLAAAHVDQAPGRTQPTNPEEQARPHSTKTAAAALGVLLPVLAASAADSKTLTPEETIDFCIEMREEMLACKDVVADVRSSRVPADKRESTRRVILQEVMEDGSGPLEARKAKCAVELKSPKAAWISHITKADAGTIRACKAQQDCKLRMACWMNAIQPIVARSRKP
jgi:RNA polymerase sigma-70 factor (ECF subfamily)